MGPVTVSSGLGLCHSIAPETSGALLLQGSQYRQDSTTLPVVGNCNLHPVSQFPQLFQRGLVVSSAGVPRRPGREQLL